MHLFHRLFCSALTSAVVVVSITTGVVFQQWISWPERTARDFVAALAEGREEDARALWSGREDSFQTALDLRSSWQRTPIEPSERSWLDAVLGRQKFNDWYLSFTAFEVVRGRVVRLVGRTDVQFFPELDIDLPRVRERRSAPTSEERGP